MHHRRFYFSLILLLTATLLPLQPAAEVHAQPLIRPVIIDTDMALDDWIAILYLLKQPDIDVKAVTVVGTGEAHCKPGMANAQHLLALAGYPEIPVACGRQQPLEGAHVFPQEWRDNMDSMLSLALPANPTPLPEITAVDLIASVLDASPEPVSIITLGPLTNIAELLTAQPDLTARIERITIMGGALSVPGNLLGLVENTVAEWNIYIDPHAASLVFSSGAPITLVPLDVTNTVPITWDFYYHLQHDRQTPSADFVFQALSKNRWFLRSGNYYFWDPLAAAIAADPTLAETETQTITVIEEEGPESGRTVADPAGSPILVATSADPERFSTTLINLLNDRPASTPLPPTVVSAEELQKNKDAVRRFYEQVWGESDFLAAEALIARDYVAHANADDVNLLNPSIIQANITLLHTLMPDLEVSVDVVAAEGDRVAAMIMIQGTHTGSYPDSMWAGPPTGNAITIRLNTVVYLVDGKLVEEWLAYDQLGLMTQTGALTLPTN